MAGHFCLFISDLPEILSAVTNKTLRQGYETYPRTFMLFCRRV